MEAGHGAERACELAQRFVCGGGVETGAVDACGTRGTHIGSVGGNSRRLGLGLAAEQPVGHRGLPDPQRQLAAVLVLLEEALQRGRRHRVDQFLAVGLGHPVGLKAEPDHRRVSEQPGKLWVPRAAAVCPRHRPGMVPPPAALGLALLLLEDSVLHQRQCAKQQLERGRAGVDVTALGDVPGSLGEDLHVRPEDEVDGAAADLQRGQVRQEVVAHERAAQDEVVDAALEVEAEAQLAGECARELERQVPPQRVHPDQLGFVVLVVGVLGPEDRHVLLVRRERQQHHVSVKTLDAVPGVGVVPGCRPLRPDERHRLVLALAGDRAVRHDHH